jgi:hypothetical protein
VNKKPVGFSSSLHTDTAGGPAAMESREAAAAPLTLPSPSLDSHRTNMHPALVPAPLRVPQDGESSCDSGASLLPAGVRLPSSERWWWDGPLASQLRYA